MTYVADTHSFLWYLSEDSRLGKNAKSAFDEAESGKTVIAIPAIVLAESMHILEKERLSMKFKDVISRIEASWNYAVVPLDLRVIKTAESLKRLPELHDRIIVASANLLSAELITKDNEIKKSGYVKTVW